MAIRKGNKHQLGLIFLLEACQQNAAGWSTAVWPANAKLPLPHRRSSITRPCCSIERSSAKLLVFTCTLKFERSTGSDSERVDALGLCTVEVIIWHDHIAISVWYQWRHRRLSLSLPLTKVTDAQYRKRFRASYNTVHTPTMFGHKWHCKVNPLSSPFGRIIVIIEVVTLEFERRYKWRLFIKMATGCESRRWGTLADPRPGLGSRQ